MEDSSLSGEEVEGGTVGVASVDTLLVQHLLHCEYLLQHLQASGPLSLRLSSGLQKLQWEAEVMSELLNMAADRDHMPRVEQGRDNIVHACVRACVCMPKKGVGVRVWIFCFV